MDDNILSDACEEPEIKWQLPLYDSDLLCASDIEKVELHLLGCSECFNEAVMLHLDNLAIQEFLKTQKTVFKVASRKLAALVDTAARLFEFPELTPVLQIRNGVEARVSEEQNSIQNALESYKRKNFKEAIEKFLQIIKGKKINESLFLKCSFYLGISYFMINEMENAYEIFHEMKSRSDHISLKYNWYLGLVCLKSFRFAEAADLFLQLSGSDSPYKEKAKKLYDILSVEGLDFHIEEKNK